MAKTEVEVRFTFPLDEVLLQHKERAERKAAVYSGFPQDHLVLRNYRVSRLFSKTRCG